MTIINNNKNLCKVYWLGIHYDWQSENVYFLCNDVSTDNPKYIVSGETEYFNIKIEIPPNVNIDNHTYEILFQYELQDGWFGGWNTYYWDSNMKINLELGEEFELDYAFFPIVPDPYGDMLMNNSLPVIFSELNHSSKLDEDKNCNSKKTLGTENGLIGDGLDSKKGTESDKTNQATSNTGQNQFIYTCLFTALFISIIVTITKGVFILNKKLKLKRQLKK